eukprot:tig00001214_g7555.t1
MGIKNLTKLIGDNAQNAIKERSIESYFGKRIAIDASMSLYQFLIGVRHGGEMLKSEAGDVTSHLSGTWYRTIRILEAGIKPVFVFDGKAPTLKSGELAKRKERLAEAQARVEEQKEGGTAEDLQKFEKRTVRVTKEHNEDMKKLLTLMGIPVVQAPCEAEAQCAELTKKGKVDGTGTEDMDSLTFGTPTVVRHLTASEAQKQSIAEFSLSAVLAGLKLTMDEFIDLCILLGCDYCATIKGVGPVNALKLITEHHTIEGVIKHLEAKGGKHEIPEDWKFAEAREFFKQPEVTPAEEIELKWGECDEEGIVAFLCGEKGFDEKRIRGGIEKIKKSKGKSSQKRLESFFGPTTVTSVKRKEGEEPAKKDAKKAKGAGKGNAAKKK